MIDKVSVLDETLLQKMGSFQKHLSNSPKIPYGRRSVVMLGNLAKLPSKM